MSKHPLRQRGLMVNIRDDTRDVLSCVSWKQGAGTEKLLTQVLWMKEFAERINMNGQSTRVGFGFYPDIYPTIAEQQ